MRRGALVSVLTRVFWRHFDLVGHGAGDCTCLGQFTGKLQWGEHTLGMNSEVKHSLMLCG